jgi:UDP-N-acetylglucosamine transferase subunit ALG13
VNTRIFVTVGTDHHPFGRLFDWVDRWAQRAEGLTLVVQHGYSPPSRLGINHRMMAATDLRRQYELADVAVTQVGPGTIADANAAGLVPIVVPRDPALHEVVDHHQYDFGAFMAARQRCQVATTEGELIELLTEQLGNPVREPFALPSTTTHTADNFAKLINGTLAHPRPRTHLGRIRSMVIPVRPETHPQPVGRG